MFSWERTEGFVNTQGKKKNNFGISPHFQGVFNVTFNFYPHFLRHHHTMLLAGMLESGGSLWNKPEFLVFVCAFFLASAADLLFFPRIPMCDKWNIPKKSPLGLKDPSRRSRRLTKPCVCPSFCLDVCREGKLISLELKQPKHYPNIWVCGGRIIPQPCFELLGLFQVLGGFCVSLRN